MMSKPGRSAVWREFSWCRFLGNYSPPQNYVGVSAPVLRHVYPADSARRASAKRAGLHKDFSSSEMIAVIV